MSVTELTPPEAARWAHRAGLSLPAERHAAVASVANHIQKVVAVLRELDFGETPTATASAAPADRVKWKGMADGAL
ncbi:hypothetical protein JK359_16190 [Streptomyces actinomycinicus]|uniref:Uncharacterized protein n=1 Tax=Streptomyces actinomycinicus TaxID=1695166 RepID=A0A937EK10_9ACTN|nr:hypothetical protein [Streptomyces actinomycinicus]MBL1083494.1 hypothetical protein [Streptomyces actinomycinicus]